MDRRRAGEEALIENRSGKARRRTNYFFADFIRQNIAFLYIWLPLALTIWGYFFSISRPFFVVGGYFFFASFLALTWRRDTAYQLKNWMQLLFVAYGLLIFTSIAIFSEDPLVSFWFLFAYLALPFIIGAKLGHQVNLRSIPLHFSVLMIVCVFVLGENIFGVGSQRAEVFGDQGNSVQLSLVCAFIFSFVFAGALNDRMRSSTILSFVVLSGFVSGAILPRWFSLASLLVLVVSVYFGKNCRAGAMSVLAFIAGWLVALFFLDGKAGFYFENLVPRVSAIDGDYDFPITSIEERIRLYFTGFELFLQNPIFGVGVGNFGYASGAPANSFPHLSLLHVASELGVFVLVLYLVLIGCSGIYLAHVSKVQPRHLPWLLIFLYGIIFSLLHGNYLTDKLIYVALGYASVLVASSKGDVRVKMR